MQAVDILAEEHETILYVLDCLEHVLQRTVSTDSFDGEAASEILAFLEHVADGSHQDKEEKIVFPKLLERTHGDARLSVESLSHEHELEMNMMRSLRANLEGAAYGDALSRDCFVVFGGAYAEKLKSHAAWENEVLLPLVEDSISDRDDDLMIAGYMAIEEAYLAEVGRSPWELLAPIRARFGALAALTPAAEATLSGASHTASLAG